MEVWVLGLLPTLLGSLVAFVPSGRTWLGPARTLALGAAVTVVLVELLPHAVEELGLGALALFLVGMSGPGVLEAVLHGRHGRLGLNLAFAGVALHQFADGLQVALARSMGPGVVLALALHGLPLVAVGVLAAVQAEGRRGAIVRGGLLLLATGLGIGLGGLVPEAPLEMSEPYLKALLAGVMLHVLGHDVVDDLPERPAERVADLVSLGVGVLAPLLLLGGGHVVEAHQAHVHATFLQALWGLLQATAPALLLALVGAAAVQALAPAVGRLLGVADAVKVAVLHPTCACDVQDHAETLRREGGSPRALVAFLLAVPSLGLEVLVLSAVLLSPAWAMLRYGSSLLLATAAALPTSGEGRAVELGGSEGRPWMARLLSALDELAVHVAPWYGLGLGLAAYLRAFVHADEVALLTSNWAGVLVLVAALGVYVHGVALVVVAALLLAHGAAPWWVFALLLLGPLANRSTWSELRQVVGPVQTAAVLLAVVAAAVVAGAAAAMLPAPEPLAASGGGIARAAAAGIVLVVLRGMWKTGARGWMGALFGDHHHDHHDHHHDHHGHHGHA